jgi:hypothetical protein
MPEDRSMNFFPVSLFRYTVSYTGGYLGVVAVVLALLVPGEEVVDRQVHIQVGPL